MSTDAGIVLDLTESNKNKFHLNIDNNDNVQENGATNSNNNYYKETSSISNKIDLNEAICQTDNKENNTDYYLNDESNNDLNNQNQNKQYSNDLSKIIATEEVNQIKVELENQERERYNKIEMSSNNFCNQQFLEKKSIDLNTIKIQQMTQSNDMNTRNCESNTSSDDKYDDNYGLQEATEAIYQINQKQTNTHNVERKCEVKTEYEPTHTPIIVNCKEILEASLKIIVPVVKVELMEVYPCQRCSNVFLSLIELHNHVIMRHMDGASVYLETIKIYRCNYRNCAKSFLNGYEYKIHIQSHRSGKLAKGMFLENFENRSLIKKYQSNECNQRFVFEGPLRAHIPVHNPMKHACHCGVKFQLRKDLSAHKAAVHVTSYNTQCQTPTSPILSIVKRPTLNVNGSKFVHKSTKELDRIRKIIPGKDNKYHCPDCTRVFKSSSSLVRHYIKHSREPRPYPCPLCHKTFTQQGAVNLHMKRHYNIKEFKCKVCERGFIDRQGLTLHMRTHTGERPLACSMCSFRFADPSALGRHLRTHTGDKIYQCESCPKRFSDASALIVHRKRHKNQRDYECDLCHKAFYTPNDARNHRYLHFSIKN